MPLNHVERQEFLAQPHIGALSVNAGPGRGPLTVPIWYQYEPGGELWFVTGAESQKIRALREAGRCTMLVQRAEPTVRYVSVEGAILRIGEMTEDEHREMAARYLPADQVDGYLKVAEAFGAMVTVRVRPEHWLSADLGGGENY
ncbi:pyridoxamine 5'-phosphate oxidase family protein [Nocardia sp. XZ_19_385]|uniref:pyridoxamine 5'-phosphate oxidase family protein n=1 Tax=Nocardia sp. XZ_19_385 TaxID=2769488 RepID=UPI00188FBEBD|nr:pyridoxamine 5'-phosphate oxidase family protein [Nocardia sp. XZ_19_385]